MSIPVAWFDPNCRRCPRIVANLAAIRAQYPDYHSAPVTPFGDLDARLLIVGLAPGLHGANRTGRPFTGDYAGILLYQTLYKKGLGNSPVSTDSGDPLTLDGCRITNAVKCFPPANKPLPREIACCNPYLQAELAVLPPSSVVVALGRVAHTAVLKALGLRQAAFPFAHGRTHDVSPGQRLIDSYHCSRYNTQTRRLTEPMFITVFDAALELLDRGWS